VLTHFVEVSSNVALDTQEVISVRSLSRQSTALVLTTKHAATNRKYTHEP